MRTNIDTLMQGQLGDWLAGQAEMRSSAKAKATSRFVWGAAILLPVFAFVLFGPGLPGGLKAFVIFGGIMAAGFWGYQPIAKAKKTIKVGINSAIAASFGVSYEHDVEPAAEFEACETYGLVPSYDRSSFEDRWFGTLESHAFDLYEAHLQEQQGSGKNRRMVTVFRGVIIKMGFGRRFRSTSLLQRAGAHRKWLGLGGVKDSVNFDGHRLDRVDQVHPAFEEVFSLYSDDQVESRVLVHPTYVEHLLQLEKAFGGKELRALFRQGEVIIAVEGRDMFESGSMDASEDHARAAEAAEQFGALAGLALAINQNERGRAGEISQPPEA
jgi:hypothetical protein